MGLDIGIISIAYLDSPQGRAYDFAMHLAQDASGDGYMHGVGNSWAALDREEMMEEIEEFSAEHNLSDREQSEVRAWVESLPWHGDLIDLCFNW